jgi:hypothetical protein
MSFFGRIFSSWFQDAAVQKLAGSKGFQSFAVKTVEAQQALEKAAKEAAKNPDAAKRVVSEGAASFWDNLKKEINRDLSKLK